MGKIGFDMRRSTYLPTVLIGISFTASFLFARSALAFAQPASAAALASFRAPRTDADNDAGAPGLVFIGSRMLMRAQQPVDVADITRDEFVQQIDVLSSAMSHHGGIGIAAPQVGWDAQVFVMGAVNDTAQSSRYGRIDVPFSAWVNPQIVWESSEKNWMWEGCLSVPGIRGWVGRPKEVRMRGYDEHGQVKELLLDGLEARIAQHEADHLQGILFPMRVSDPRFLVPMASFDEKDDWMEGWPSPGSYATGKGKLSDEK